MTRYGEKQKQEVIGRLGWPRYEGVAEIHRSTGVPLSTLYAWRRALRNAQRAASRVHAAELGALVQTLPLFSGVPRPSLERLLRVSRARTYCADATVVPQGARVRTTCFVLRGSVKQTYASDDGLVQVMRVAGPGDMLHDVAAWQDKPALYGSAAIVDSLVLQVPVAALRSLLNECGAFARCLLDALYGRLDRDMHDAAALATHNGLQRIAGFVLRETDRRATTRLDLPWDHRFIASRLRVTPEYFSRALQRLARRGCIDVASRRITVRDRRSLREILLRGGVAYPRRSSQS